MDDKLEKDLLEAVGKSKKDISIDNSFRDIAFDAENKRLGWVNASDFSQIKESLEDISKLLEGKKYFIFVGMGGSINGIKPLISLFKADNFFTLDNLDPKALSDIIDKIDDFENTLVVSISKSGTTKETQLLSATLKEVFIEKLPARDWQENFLWVSDLCSFSKLDSLGWTNVKKICIQFNKEFDIGGRFSSPQTMIFILPLYILLKKDFLKLKQVYGDFAGLLPKLRKVALGLALDHINGPNAYFSPLIDSRLGESLSSWIVQLIQESLGSKQEGLQVKTIPNLEHDDLFMRVKPGLDIDDPVVSLMSQMYFFQAYVAFYSAGKNVNFVTQNYVEKYKDKLRSLEGKSSIPVNEPASDFKTLFDYIDSKIKSEHRFIEIVLYFYPEQGLIDEFKENFSSRYKDKKIMLFLGSDWNHQSYQAAFASSDTFFVLLTLANVKIHPPIDKTDILKKNIDTLKLIAKATYLTIDDKSILLSIERDF
ncbi:MAG: hypothetical protein JW867_05645 [Candidatus Omnitrophica bacterium]|nr:hypothetical protein [Candidatus Omnitrophota bacterium]